MRALRYHDRGPAVVPVVEDVPVPRPSQGELLVRVTRASLNPVDWKIADGKFRFLVHGGMPRTMGSDFAGEVAAIGPGVSGWRAGEPVMGFVDPFARAEGTFAEFVSVPSVFVARRPLGIDDRVGAALSCVGVTAVAMCDLAQVDSGTRVLVNGASGGVGHIALQLAKARGASVTAVASAARRELIQKLGADDFLDYRSLPPEQWPGAFDAVLDCVPSIARARHRRLLKHGGRYASTLPDAFTYTLDPLLNRWGRLRRHAVMLRPDSRAMDELAGLVRAARLHCEIAGEFALADAERAIALSRTGRVAGKLIIRID
jgi:NADPH:quinone reductase-like Zn-dependent oxidoreductase